MRNSRQLTALKISSLILILGVLLFLALRSGQQKVQIARAGQAGNIPMRGYAWADTVGWLRMWRDKGTVQYGVTVDHVTGNFDDNSWAWSSNYGWVAFFRPKVCSNQLNKACSVNADCGVGTCNRAVLPSGLNAEFATKCPNCAATDWCSACYNTTDKKVYGWSYILSIEDGTNRAWMRLNDIAANSVNYNGLQAISYDAVSNSPAANADKWGDLEGWGWASSFENSLSKDFSTGWLSFNCSNRSTCATNAYKISAQPPVPILAKAYPRDGLNSRSVDLQWVINDAPNSGVTTFQIWRREGHCASADSALNNKVCDNTAQCVLQGSCGSSNQCIVANIGAACTPANGATVCRATGTCTISALSSRVLDKNNNGVQTGSGATSYTDGEPTPNTQPLALYRTYYYKIYACNIFGCSMSNERQTTTSPFDNVSGFTAKTTCNKANSSAFVDLQWDTPYIEDNAYNGGMRAASYNIQYCLVDGAGNYSNCTDLDWKTPENGAWAKNCYNPAQKKFCQSGNNFGNTCTTSADCGGSLCVDTNKQFCQDRLTTTGLNRYPNSTKPHVYRIRAVGNDVINRCQGGDKDSANCVNNASCTVSGACQGICQGGNNDGAVCQSDTDCPSGSCTSKTCTALTNKVGQACSANTDCDTTGTCVSDNSKSSWTYSRVIYPCRRDSDYREDRPQAQ